MRVPCLGYKNTFLQSDRTSFFRANGKNFAVNIDDGCRDISLNVRNFLKVYETVPLSDLLDTYCIKSKNCLVLSYLLRARRKLR